MAENFFEDHPEYALMPPQAALQAWGDYRDFEPDQELTLDAFLRAERQEAEQQQAVQQAISKHRLTVTSGGFCGPTAIAAITGASSEDVEQLVLAHRKSNPTPRRTRAR